MAVSGGHGFQSLPVIQQLAHETGQAPPKTSGRSLDFVDTSLVILGRGALMKDEFQARTTLQEKAIRVEFEQQRIQTDRGFAEQREYMDERFDDVDGKFDEQRKYMDRRFDDVDEKFDSQRKYMDGRFEVIDRRFEQVNNRFEKVDERFDRLEGRFDQMEGRFHNSMLGSAWEEIYPIGMFNPLAEPGNRFRMPKYFPNRVVKFWRLKRPRQLPTLTYLLKFYEIKGYEYWGSNEYMLDSEESDSDSELNSLMRPRHQSLAEAVRSNPDIAHRALATHLGLTYDRIAHALGPAEAQWRYRKESLTKRTLHGGGEMGRDTKVARREPLPVPVPTLTMEELMREKSATKSPSPPSAVLSWENSIRLEMAGKKAREEKGERQELSTERSEDLLRKRPRRSGEDEEAQRGSQQSSKDDEEAEVEEGSSGTSTSTSSQEQSEDKPPSAISTEILSDSHRLAYLRAQGLEEVE